VNKKKKIENTDALAVTLPNGEKHSLSRKILLLNNTPFTKRTVF
jgi:hypothetical protein